MYFPFFYDPTFLMIIPAFIFALWAQYKVKSAYKKYSKIKEDGITSAADLARKILDNAGAKDVKIEAVPGEMTDHYDPRKKVLRLSNGVYNSNSVAACGIAAHEVGHALQHQHSYVPLVFRNGFFPVANIGSSMAFPLFFIGMLFSLPILMNIGIFVFTFAVIFHIVTLPVEFDASGRAIKILKSGGYLDEKGLQGAKAVLSAAALTYLASTAMAIMQLIRLIILRGRDD